MRKYTTIYKAQITEILDESSMLYVPKDEDGTYNEKAIAEEMKKLLDVDDVVIESMKVFAGEED